MTMKISYDREVDALYICFKETTVTTKHLEDGIALDYDEADRLAGIEILDAMKRLDDPEIFKQVVIDIALGEIEPDSMLIGRTKSHDQERATVQNNQSG